MSHNFFCCRITNAPINNHLISIWCKPLLTPTHPPTHPTRASIFKPLLDFLGSRKLVWKLYCTKLGQLAKQLATSQSPRNAVASYNISIWVISQPFQVRLSLCKKQSWFIQFIQSKQLSSQPQARPTERPASCNILVLSQPFQV